MEMSERRCKWCYRTAAEIAAIIEANGLKQPARIFDRADAWAKCILCRARKRKTGQHSATDAASPEQQVYVHRRGFVRKHGRDNRDVD